MVAHTCIYAQIHLYIMYIYMCTCVCVWMYTFTMYQGNCCRLPLGYYICFPSVLSAGVFYLGVPILWPIKNLPYIYSVKIRTVIAVRAWPLARSHLETLSSRMWVQKVNSNEPFPPQLTHHGKKSGAGCFACSSAVWDGGECWIICVALAQMQSLGKLSPGVGKCSGYPSKVIFPLQIGIFLLSYNLSPSDKCSKNL